MGGNFNLKHVFLTYKVHFLTVLRGSDKRVQPELTNTKSNSPVCRTEMELHGLNIKYNTQKLFGCFQCIFGLCCLWMNLSRFHSEFIRLLLASVSSSVNITLQEPFTSMSSPSTDCCFFCSWRFGKVFSTGWSFCIRSVRFSPRGEASVFALCSPNVSETFHLLGWCIIGDSLFKESKLSAVFLPFHPSWYPTLITLCPF